MDARASPPPPRPPGASVSRCLPCVQLSHVEPFWGQEFSILVANPGAPRVWPLFLPHPFYPEPLPQFTPPPLSFRSKAHCVCAHTHMHTLHTHEHTGHSLHTHCTHMPTRIHTALMYTHCTLVHTLYTYTAHTVHSHLHTPCVCFRCGQCCGCRGGDRVPQGQQGRLALV